MRPSLRHVLAAIALAGGCQRPANPPIVDTDAATPVVDASTGTACELACARLGSLGCPEAEALPGGKSCVVLCADAEESGKFSLRPDCVADAGTVADVRVCGTVRCMR